MRAPITLALNLKSLLVEKQSIYERRSRCVLPKLLLRAQLLGCAPPSRQDMKKPGARAGGDTLITLPDLYQITVHQCKRNRYAELLPAC
jgi:hypothetical protein